MTEISTQTKKTTDKITKIKKPMSSNPKQKSKNEIEDFKIWLKTLPTAPKLHVNGAEYSAAIISIDFGTPLEEAPKMTTEQNAELVAKMKSSTRFLYNKPDMNVRVQSDTNNGIWWTSIN
jgi:hypothetical protein